MTKKILLPAIAFCLFVPRALGASDSGSLSLEIRSARGVYEVGEKIPILVKMRNKGEGDVMVNVFSFREAEDLETIVYGPDGPLERKIDLQRRRREPEAEDFIPLGKEGTFTSHLNLWSSEKNSLGYELKKEGVYSLAIVYANEEDGQPFGLSGVWRGNLVSNILSFTLVGPHEETLPITEEMNLLIRRIHQGLMDIRDDLPWLKDYREKALQEREDGRLSIQYYLFRPEPGSSLSQQTEHLYIVHIPIAAQGWFKSNSFFDKEDDCFFPVLGARIYGEVVVNGEDKEGGEEAIRQVVLESCQEFHQVLATAP